MSIKNILVHVGDSKHCAARLDVAVDLTRRFAAHLVGVYAIPDPYIASYMAGGDSSYVPAAFIKEQIQRGRDLAATAEAGFRAHLEKAGVDAEWRAIEGNAGDVISLNARYADLTIVGQADPDDREGYPDPGLPAEVALTSGRPILVVPYVGPGKTLAKNIMVAWNASREATRAVNDALPLLQAADKVSLLAVDPEKGGADHGEIPCADIALFLARHGVKAEAIRTVSNDLEIADVFLSRIADLGSDLLVMGAYGHSRMREFVMGGATRGILSQMTVPVLMSH